ncbi:outer membrane protein [Methylocystis sp. S23]|jgi:outer membrane immunogenic protein
MTKRLILSPAAALLVTGAVAADLPSIKAPPAPPQPLFSWTGFYVGPTIGGGWANTGSIDGVSLTPGLAATGVAWTSVSPGASGVIGGVQAGYNYQFAGTGFVVGLETDFLGADINSSTTVIGSPVVGTAVFPFITTRQSLDWFGTVRGRVGYAILPTLLIFGTGGFAYGHTSSNFVIGFTNGFFDGAWESATRTGWTAGGGLEWAFLPNLSLKIEYLYVDLGSGGFLLDDVRHGHMPPPAPPPVVPLSFISGQTGAPHRFHTAKIGLNYHFNLFGAPAPSVLASY